jgi:mannose-6-phosphate isomerase-like protein (cupin superfamily)
MSYSKKLAHLTIWRSALLGSSVLLLSVTGADAQQNIVTVFPKAQIDQLIKAPPNFYDRTLRILDMGTYQLAVAVATHEPTSQTADIRPASRGAKAVACGISAMPAGAKSGPSDGISHDDTSETYVVISGSGTLVTGGRILNGSHSAPDSETSKYLAGPSCLGPIVGNVKTHEIAPGDVVVIPAGVPHGWANVTSKMTYLTIRPDPKKVLQSGYVNPGLK